MDKFDPKNSHWTPIERVADRTGGQYWLMKCECGTEKEVSLSSYTYGGSKSCGCSKSSKPNAYDFDIKESRWTPIERAPNRGQVKYWLMKCDCGTVKEVCWKHYLSGQSKSCGCLRRELSKGELADKRRKAPGERARNKIMYTYRKHAEKAGRAFSLTVEEFTELTSGNCHYCGRPPVRTHTPWTRPGRESFATNYDYNGIDRKDSSLGYVLENCLTSCYECNRAKMDMGYDEFIEYLNVLVTFRNALL